MEKVFCIGFSKTGTTSLETALETFGYKVMRGHWQHPYTFYSHALWIHRDYDELLKLTNYWDAFADAPWGGTTLYEELYRRLPDSKFILTVRDAEKWYVSLEKLLTMFDLDLETAFESYHSNGMWGSQYFFRHVFDIDKLAGNRQKIIDAYNAYNQNAIDFFAKKGKELLVMDFEKGDGWKTLAPFLGKAVPPIPFPHQNQAVQNPYLSNKKPAGPPPKRNLIVQIYVGHPNDVESARYVKRAFAEFGYEVVQIALAQQQQATDALNALVRDRGAEIFCFISDNYYAKAVVNAQGALLHTMTGIPLVIWMHDHPVLFLTEQTPNLAGSIAFVPGEDAREYIAAYYPAGTKTIANTGSYPPIPSETPDWDQFRRRRNMILAPLNLNFGNITLESAWQQLKALTPGRKAAATALIEATLTDTVRPLHEIAATLPHTLAGEEAEAAKNDHLLVQLFVKLWRRQQMVRALIDLPILISSEFVPPDLAFKYSKKFTLFSMSETVPHYRDYRFALNSHPLMMGLLHDRVTMATALNAACITDVNTAVEKYLHDGVDSIFFDYAKMGEMAQRVAGYLDDPERAFALTVHAAEARDATDHFGYRVGYENLIAAVSKFWPAESLVAPPERIPAAV